MLLLLVCFATALLAAQQAGVAACMRGAAVTRCGNIGGRERRVDRRCRRLLCAAGKWARGPWAGSDDDERRVKEETSATLRCFPFDQPAHSGTCFMTGAPAAEVAIFAKAY